MPIDVPLRRLTFHLNSQPVSDSIHIGEVGDGLAGVVDSSVIEPDLSQTVNVSSLHRRRMSGQLESVAKQFSVGLANCRLQGVRPSQRLDELRIGTQCTESRSVVAQSVMASIVGGYQYGQHFPLHSAQRGRPVHHGSIKS